MNEEIPSQPNKKPGVLVRAFLIVLPVGLAFMVPLSLWIYYQKKYRPQPVVSEYAAVLQRDLNEGDFENYVTVLSQDIEKQGATPELKREAAAKFIESSMDFVNMGYAVRREVFKAQGKDVTCFMAELPGSSRRVEVVLVAANLDITDPAAVAGLMGLAHALTGFKHARTIRFAVVMEGAGVLPELWAATRGEKERLRRLIHLRPVSQTQESWEAAQMLRDFPMAKSDAPGVSLTRLNEVKEIVDSEADAP